MKNRFFAALTSALVLVAVVAGLALPALAQTIGAPVEGALGFQPAASPVAERMHSFHNLVLYIITFITLFVLALLMYVVVRFNSKANPVPSTRTHNVVLEVVWTVIPVVILIIIAIPSISLLYYGDRVTDPDMTINVTGYQWYWGYEYPDHENVSFMSNMIPDKEIDAGKGQIRLLSVDNPIVLPIDKNIQIIVTAGDVLHSFAVPSFGVKVDAVPGRNNESWTRITKPGVYYGQCSELCGKNHAFMPIEVRAVPQEEFDAWVEFAKGGDASYHEFKAQYVKLAQIQD